MIKTTKGSDRKRKRRGDYWEERDERGKVMIETAMGNDRETYTVLTLLKDPHMHA